MSSTQQIARSRGTGELSPLENAFAEVLADVVGVERVSVDDHFFDDLGTDSMVMARFCARIRKRPDLPAVSMKDIYRYPTDKEFGRRVRGPHTRHSGRIPGPGRIGGRAADRGGGSGQHPELRPLRDPAAAVLPRVLLPRRAGRRRRFRVDLRRIRRDRHLPAVGRVRRRDLHRPVRPSDPGEVGARRSVEAPADPGLEPRVRPLLGGQDADPAEPAGPVVRRFAALRALPEGAGCESRARCRDLLPERPRVHRPAHHRRRHGHPQGLVLHLLPSSGRPDPDGRGHHRKGRRSSAR